MLALTGVAPAFAYVADPLIEGAKQCTVHLPRYERQYGIPVHLLSAIASTESGRWHDGLKIAVPWPWTINAEGKGYFFESKQEAIKAVQKLHAQGIKSIDVGCMQVNLMHHPEAFASLEDAFEPETNVAYAASFLRTLFEELKSWKNAAAAYHSRTPVFGADYVSRVYDRWYTIIERVRNARLNGGGETQLADAAAQAADHSPPAPAGSVHAAKSRQAAPNAVRMHVISVKNGSEGARENGVIMVRPEIKPAELMPATATVTPTAATAQAATPAVLTVADATAKPSDTVPPAHVIHISASGKSSDAPKTSGPRFIFND